MAETTLTNPSGALQGVTDFTTYKAPDGSPVQYGKVVLPFRANAAITAGQALRYVAATTTVPLSVTPMALNSTAAQLQVFAGIALNSAASGARVDVCVGGVCLAQISTTAAVGSATTGGTAVTPALGVPAVNGGTGSSNADGDTYGATTAATVITGYVMGIYLGAPIGTTLRAPLLVRAV